MHQQNKQRRINRPRGRESCYQDRVKARKKQGKEIRTRGINRERSKRGVRIFPEGFRDERFHSLLEGIAQEVDWGDSGAERSNGKRLESMHSKIRRKRNSHKE